MGCNIKINNTRISHEKELEEYLINNMELIEEGMTLVKNQYRVPNGVIDILAKDKEDRLCIIELKLKEDCRELIYQCVYYRTQFDKPVRVIAICPEYSARIHDCLINLNVEMKLLKNDNQGNLIIKDYYSKYSKNKIIKPHRNIKPISYKKINIITDGLYGGMESVFTRMNT